MRDRRLAVWVSAAAIGLFQLVGSFGAAHNQPDRRPMDALAVLLVLVGPAALAVRDRWPLVTVGVTLAASAVYVGMGYAYGPIFLSVIVALVSAVLRGRRRGTWCLAAAGYVGFVVASVVDPYHDGSVLVPDALVAGWLIVVLAVAELVRSRRDVHVARERATQEERQRRAGDRRLELAQELHDVLAHHISLINVQAGVALHLMDDHPERVAPALTAIKHASREALHELRGALEILRRADDAPRAPAPGLAELDPLVATVAASGLDVRLTAEGVGEPLPAAVELAAYRIVQEALTNVSRHARARSATVRVRVDDGITVEVTDDGIGGAATAGNGITGMRQRAAALGGTVEAAPCPGGGFRVVAHLPLAGVPSPSSSTVSSSTASSSVTSS